MDISKQDLKDAFAMFDKTGDGMISRAELCDLFQYLGHVDVTEEELHALMTELPPWAEDSSSGSINNFSYEGFTALWQHLLEQEKEAQEAELKEAFRAFDQDGNGLISLADLRFLMTHLGENMTEAQLSEMMREADTDKDGVLDYQEFVRAMLK